MRRLVPTLLLLAYGGAFAVAAFGRGLPAFDDHPGQYFRLWHALERSLPDGFWTADWNPDWWGGYPELTFYPPGFALVGTAIRLLGFWQPSVELTYQLLCALALLLPALATFALLRAVLDDAWLALPPAFLALTLSAGLRGGIEEGLRWGMLTSRLSMGCLPLLALSLRPWIETGRTPVWAPVAAAAIVLSHPANAPATVIILGAATLLCAALRPRGTLLTAVTLAGIAVALTAFWTFPFIGRRGWVVPLAWGQASEIGFLGAVRSQPILLVIGLGALLAWITVLGRRRPFDAYLAALPIALLGLSLGNVGLFHRGWSQIEPGRLLDSLAAAALWAAGLGVGSVIALLTGPRARRRARPLIALGVIALVALVPARAGSEPALVLWPRAGQWPSWDELSRRHHLPDLWRVLRGRPDRVFFATSALPLGPGSAWYGPHSHAFSLAPVFAGREIVHGTFTHPAPLAARFYTGSAALPVRLPILAEQLDHARLLGQPWEQVTADAFDAFARRLRIATVVMPSALASRAPFLGDRYVASSEVAGLTIFERRDRPWAEVERITHRRYRVLVSPTGGVWIPTGIPAYPLWRARARHGALETRTDAWGMLEFRVPLDVFEAELVYGEGPLEWLSLALTLVGGVVWLGWTWRARSHGASPPRQPHRPTRTSIDRRRRR